MNETPDEIDVVEALGNYLDNEYVDRLGWVFAGAVGDSNGVDEGVLSLEVHTESGEDVNFELRVKRSTK